MLYIHLYSICNTLHFGARPSSTLFYCSDRSSVRGDLPSNVRSIFYCDRSSQGPIHRSPCVRAKSIAHAPTRVRAKLIYLRAIRSSRAITFIVRHGHGPSALHPPPQSESTGSSCALYLSTITRSVVRYIQRI